MTEAADLARELVAYDREVAAAVLAAVERALPASLADEAKTTREWKADFARFERLRSLARELEAVLA